MDLYAAHERVRLRVKELAAGRSGPAYIIEHDLSSEEVDKLFTSVRRRLVNVDPTDSAWDATYGSLLVCAVEVGYLFGSTGREYWPVLSDRLDHDFDDDRRRALCKYFETWGQQSGVRPPQSRWAQAFHLIAWPITNAVLPVWLHEPLYASLLACPLRIGPDSGYLDWMRANVRNATRLEHFLAQDGLAGSVIEALLDLGGGGHLAPELRARLNRDVRANSTTKRLHRELKAKIDLRNIRAPRRPSRPVTDAAVRTVLDLRLILEEGDNHIRVRPPRLPYAAAFDIESAKTRLLGTRRAVSVVELLQNGAVIPTIPTSQPDASTVRLIDENDVPDVPKQLKEHLGAFAINCAQPLLFSEFSGETAARQVHEGQFAPRPGWWVLTNVEAPDSDRIVYHGKVHSLRLYKVDATNRDPNRRSGEEWLRALGLRVAKEPRLAFFGSPSLDTPGATAGLLLSGDALAFQVESDVSLEGSSLAPGLYELDLTNHSTDLEFSAPQCSPARLGLEVCDQRQHRPLVEVDLVGKPTVQALLDRELAIRITGAPVVGLRVTLQLLSNDGTEFARAVSAPLGRLPQAIAPNDPAWSELLEISPSDGRTLVLVAQVSSLGGARWPLDPALIREDNTAVFDEVADAMEKLSASQPWEEANENAAAWLTQPFAGGAPLLGAGVCCGPPRSEPPPPLALPNRSLRTMETRRNEPGVRRLAACWLSWSTASAPDAIAAWYRKRACDCLDTAITSAVCGDVWTAAEARADADRRTGFGRRLALALISSGVVCDPEADALLASRAPTAFAEELGRRLETSEAWLRAYAEADQPASLAAGLFDAANASYAFACAQTGLPLDLADPACPEAESVEAVRPILAIQQQITRSEAMLALVLPRTMAANLADIVYATPRDADVVSELTSVIRKRGGPRWTLEEVEALWVGWARPWRSDIAIFERALRRAIDDRGAARAVRYAAVMSRTYSGGTRGL